MVKFYTTWWFGCIIGVGLIMELSEEKMKYINDLFDNLDTWRHLPAYQLERCADIFFSLYLPDLLLNKFDIFLRV